MGRCKIICSLDGKESDSKLYGEFADLSMRTVPNEQYALNIQAYLIKRSVRLSWDVGLPTYQIVPVDE